MIRHEILEGSASKYARMGALIALGHRAFEYLAAQRGRHFDPRLAEAFMGLGKEIAEIQGRWQDPAKA